MARVKRGTKRRARRKKYLKRTKGFFLTKSKLYQSAQEAANRAEQGPCGHRGEGRPRLRPARGQSQSCRSASSEDEAGVGARRSLFVGRGLPRPCPGVLTTEAPAIFSRRGAACCAPSRQDVTGWTNDLAASFRAKRGISLRRQHNVGYSFVGRNNSPVGAR